MTTSTIAGLINSSQKTLFILCGLPYSGKTYVSERLCAEVGMNVVRIDDILRKRGFDWNTNKLPNEAEWRGILEESYQATKNILERSENVLYDSTNHTLTSREKLRELAKQSGAETAVIFVNTPKSLIWERWEKNIKLTTRSIVAKDLVEMTINAFEPPTQDEHVIEISGI